MDLRIRLFIISIMAALAALAWTLPQWWAFANPESPIAGGLPELELEARARFDAFPAEEQAAYFLIYEGDEEQELEPNPEWALDLVRARLFGQDTSAPEASQSFELPAGATQIATGTFLGIDIVRAAEGDIFIYLLPDGTRLLRLDENFRTVRAPDLHLILTRNPDPMDERGVGVDYIEIAALRGTVGAQNYTIPQSADFSRYPVMAIYSQQHDEVIATLTIR